MADNTILSAAVGVGDTVRTLDDGTVKWPAGVTAYATTIGTPDVLAIVTLTDGLPVQPQTGAVWSVTVSSGSITTTEAGAATGTRTQVADNAADVLLLASNASRLGATVFNDSSALLYLGLGTTAVTTTNYTAKVFPNGYYEAPYRFTGQIRGIWATDPGDGGAKVTELT